MPLVVSKTGEVSYVRHEDTLAEILGHDNFDGEDWAIGDSIIFEDGTESRITQEAGELSYTWGTPTAADLESVKRAIGVEDADNWKELFARFEVQSQRNGCLAAVCIVLALLTAFVA